MKIVQAILTFGGNENPIVRVIRLAVMAGLAAASAYVLREFANIDFPGNNDALIIAFGTPLLAGIDKWIRGMAPA